MVLKKSSWGVPKRDSSNVKLTGLSFWLLTPFTSSCILRQGKISWDKGYPNPEERIKMSVFLCPKSLQSKTFLVPLLGCYKRKNHHGLHWCYKFWCHFFQVANVWCAFNVAIKIKDLYDVQTLAMGCLASTALASLPTNILLFMQPSKANLILALINTSLEFFLFSFQVHEKSILLVGIPVALLLGVCDFFRADAPNQERQRILALWGMLISCGNSWNPSGHFDNEISVKAFQLTMGMQVRTAVDMFLGNVGKNWATFWSYWFRIKSDPVFILALLELS